MIHDAGSRRKYEPSRRGWRVIFAACVLLSVAPLFAARHLPFEDLPEHVAAMSTLRHWFDPAWPDANIYELSGRGSPYLAYHVLGAVLTAVTGDALRANLVLMTAVGLAIPLAVRSLVLASGGDERLALFGCATFWCRPLVTGFLPFMAAVPLALFAIALTYRQVASPTKARDVALAIVTLLVFYLHLEPFLLFVAVAILLNLVAPTGSLGSRFAQLPRRLVWLAPAAIATVVWVARAHAEAGLRMMGDGAVHFESLVQLARELPTWAHGIWRTPVSKVTGFALWGLVLVLALHARVPETRGVRGLIVRLVPFGCALALFLFMPSQVGVTSMLNARLAVFLLPCILVVLRPNPGRVTSLVMGAAALLACIVSVESAVQVQRAERDEIPGIDRLLELVQPGARLLTLDFESSSSHVAIPPWIHLGALHRLRGGGVASVSFAEVPHWPLAFRTGLRPPSVPGRSLEWQPCRFRNTIDGRYYDHVLVRGRMDPFRHAPPGPRWELAGREGNWALFVKLLGPEIPARGPDLGPCDLPFGM